MHINAGQSVVDAGVSGVDDAGHSGVCSLHAGCMQGVGTGQSSVDARMQAACSLHVDHKIRLV